MAESLRQAAGWVGMQQLQFDWANSSPEKDRRGVCGLIRTCQGLGVDEVADYLVASNCADFMVDIGGEMRTWAAVPRAGSGASGLSAQCPASGD